MDDLRTVAINEPINGPNLNVLNKKFQHDLNISIVPTTYIMVSMIQITISIFRNTDDCRKLALQINISNTINVTRKAVPAAELYCGTYS